MNTPETKRTSGQSNGSQMRITDEERALIKSTFLNNEPLLKLMRKMFLPELDPNAPIGQMIDLWMTISIKDMSPEDAIIKLTARNELISHVDQVLMQLWLISKLEPMTPEEVKAKMVADGNK